jgi:hypothetical protein
MRRSFGLLALPAMAIIALRPGQAKADFIPPTGLAPGSQYEIMFVTSDRIGGSLFNYNQFAQTEASLNPTLPAATWHAIVSTSNPNSDAFGNAPSSPGIPVYDTLGNLITATGLYNYDPYFYTPPDHDEYGSPYLGEVWTGSNPDGYAAQYPLRDGPLNTTEADVGLSYVQNYGWIYSGGTELVELSLPIYALSSPITVPAPAPTPGPASLTMLVTGVLAVGAIGVSRRRRQATTT